jgi:23S rRNA (uracil1939-C5)-methyltransferase
MELLIESISHNGEGVARNGGKVVFIPYAIPGELVKAEIIEEKKKYSRGILREIVKQSPHRIEPKCPYYYHCGGCSYQHINYNQQLILKKSITKEIMIRIGGINPTIKSVIDMQESWNYRNKVLWHICDSRDGKKMGFYRYQSKKLIEIDNCPLLLPELNKISFLIKEMLPEIYLEGNSSIMLRQSSDSNQTILEFINCFADRKLVNRLSREIDNIYEKRDGRTKIIAGQGLIKEKAGECYFLLGADDFFQVNPEQSESMINTVAEYLNLSGHNKVLDAYCGAGMFALNIADKAVSVVGIDSNIWAVRNARRNAELNSIENCQFISGQCEVILSKLQNSFDRIIVNPPRTGVKPEVINAIVNIYPEIIVYVSCNPATLARDIKQLVNNSYNVANIQPIDMFPQTSHIENIVLLRKK